MKEDKITNLDLLWYFVKILIIYTETSDLPLTLRSVRAVRLEKLLRELGLYYD